MNTLEHALFISGDVHKMISADNIVSMIGNLRISNIMNW